MKGISAIILMLCSLGGFSQADTMQARLILIGDAGSLKNGRHPVIDAVKQTLKMDKKTTVLFLGDNLYTYGLPDEEYAYYDVRRTVLDTQIAIANGTDAKVIFIPGNHDWDRGGAGGWDAILREQHYIDSKGGKNVKFYPEEGCGGPVEVPLSDDATLIIFDSQWWIHPYDKPGVESDCPYKTKLEILDRLEDLLSKNSKKLVVLACHHPFKSYGIHGGYFKLKQYVFPLTDVNPSLYIPLPVIGTIYPIVRKVFGVPEDLAHPAYENMIKEISRVAQKHPNLIFVAGHEHNLQYIKDSNSTYIISGSGTKSTRVSGNAKAPFTSMLNGYAVLDVSKNKNVDVAFYTVSDSVRKAFSGHVLNFSKLPPPVLEDSIPLVYTYASEDSISIAANEDYAKASKTHRFFSGDNYRNVWAAKVKLKIFRVNKEMGGFKVGDLGGGHQTRSLKLTDKNGKEWALRTINKDISRVLPEGFKGSVLDDFLQDFISTAHPYSPLIVPSLAKAANVIVAKPKIYFVPNDPALGFYRSYFANSLCLLEEKEPVPNNEETKSEQKMMSKMLEDNTHHVDQQAFLRARLLDFLIADWDRHYNQWRFMVADTGKGKLYVPMPRDRDQAFTYSNGFLLRLGTKYYLPFLRGFTKKINGIQWLAYWAKDLDRSFLNSLDSATWKKVIKDFKGNVTDKVIDDAVKNLPPEVYKISGADITRKLKSRRDDLAAKKGMEYYRFLAKQVNVVGSNEDEYFKIESVGKNLKVRVYKKTKKTDSATVVYSRVFEPSMTKEIDLYGLNGNDYFEVDSNTSSPIRIRMIGGKGNDTFDVKGSISNYLYDISNSQNVVLNRNRTKVKFDDDPAVNRYSQTGYRYDSYTFPLVNLGYNAEDGLLAGLGFAKKTYGFRKDPYSTNQKLSTLYAPRSGSYKIRYESEFNEVLGKNDLLVNAEAAKPTLNNFFGIGNSTTKLSNDIQYYRVRYNYISGEVLFRRRLQSYLHIAVGPQVFNYWNHIEDNQGKILNTPSLVGLDSTDIYRNKAYVGGKLSIVINNLNNELLPTRGLDWRTEFSALEGINKYSKSLTTLTSDMSVYAAITDPAKVIAIMKIGGGKIFSKNYEYFQALNLGQNNYLRGFRKNRFAGSAVAYGSMSLLIKLFQSKSYFFPGSVGLLVFDDIGRVWADQNENGKWHNAYGGGIYYTPFNLILISAALGFSKEETLFNLSIGAKLNLTF